MHFTLEAPNQHRRLHKLGVEIVPYHLPSRVEEGAVVATHVYDEDGHEKSFAADAVVWVAQRRSNEALFRELKDSDRSRTAQVRGDRRALSHRRLRGPAAGCGRGLLRT